ncbi:ATG3 [Candida jiufengensis]|uniref:ATG3 n=1 Tax=Candida jiufengensis TaxID=497108 RepID=UPI002225530C|nr:ATG3 [Candida jiufengensis]KAI5955629.1 ATG3 [Candida jiufengensis]
MLRSKLSSLREYLTPINHNSNFLTTGEISPEEFVKAGDYLVYKFPTWSWSSCPKNLQKSFLPEDKQVLVTKHVPSHVRANKYYDNGEEEEEEEEDADKEELNENDEEYGWIKSKKSKKIKEIEEETKEINDIDEFIDENAEDDELEEDFDDLDIKTTTNSNLRKYDLYITYSTSYRVPKLYLVGFNSNGIPLLPNQMYEDINSDYKDKTVTIENLPVAHNTTSISIHPCKHSSVMKVLMNHQINKKEKTLENLSINDKEEEEVDKDEENTLRPDHYLVIFLKFIASVTPGIEYDYTMDAL